MRTPPTPPLPPVSSLSMDMLEGDTADSPGRGDVVVRVAAALVIFVICIAFLYLGREILVPLALAALLGFVLDPLVTRFKRWGLPRPAGALVVVLLTLSLILGLLGVVGNQAKKVADDLPKYESTIKTKLKSFRQLVSQPGTLSRASKTLDAVQNEVATVQPGGLTLAPSRDGKPIKVDVVKGDASPVEQLTALLGTVGGPLTSAGFMLIFLYLTLLDKRDLQDRVLRLIGGNIHRTTDALGEVAVRIKRYLTMQLVVNVSYGTLMGLGLWFIGVPGAWLWGLVSAVMRFVPYIGAWIAALLPITLAFAVDPSWSMVLYTVGLIVALELLVNNVAEPMLYGSSTGLTAMSLIVGAAFWTALWGPVGLVLSTPLTVCLVVLGKHLPQLSFFGVLLGSQPALDVPSRLYQRLLAGDTEDALDLAEDTVERVGTLPFYQDAALPLLKMASHDHTTVATAAHRLRVLSGLQRIFQALQENDGDKASTVTAESSDAPIVCVGGRWELDDVSAQMMAHVMREHQLPAQAQRGQNLAGLDLSGARIVCLSYLSPTPQVHARSTLRRLKRKWPNLKVMLAFWNATEDDTEWPSAMTHELGAKWVVTQLDEMVTLLKNELHPMEAGSFLKAPVDGADEERVRRLVSSGLFDSALRGTMDRLAKRAADVFDTPIALVSLIDADQQWTHGDSTQRGRGEIGPPELGASRDESLCGHAVHDGETLVVPDVQVDYRFANNPELQKRGIRFYAGAPLKDTDGFSFGTLCLIDTQPRQFTEQEKKLLAAMADDVMRAVSAHQAAVETQYAQAHLDATPPAASVNNATRVLPA